MSSNTNNENDNKENNIMPKYSLVTTKKGEDFKSELQKSIEQYKYEFEKRLYNVLNKDILNSTFDPNKNIFDVDGNFITTSDRRNSQSQKSKRKSKSIGFLRKNSFIYSSSNLNYDLGSQNFGSLNNRKYKSENNISELRKRNMSSQYLNKNKAFSYNNVSTLQNNKPGSIGNSLYDIDKKNYKSKSRKDYQIRKTYEDLQRELENIENEFKTNPDEINDNKIIDLRKKELHKNYKEYIKLNNSTDNPNLRRYKNYVNDFEWAKQRHLDAINKQNTPKTTTEIDEITERLYNPDNYPNVYKMKFSGKSNEKLDSNSSLNKKVSSSRKKLNSSSKEKINSQSESTLNSNDDEARARMIDQINNFSPLSPENFTMKSSKTKMNGSTSLNNLNVNISNPMYPINEKGNNNSKNNINENTKSNHNLKKSNMNINSNSNNNLNENNNVRKSASNISGSKSNISKNKVNSSMKSINNNNKGNKVSFSTEEIHKNNSKSSDNLKSSTHNLNSMKNLSSSNKNISSKSSLNELRNKSSSNLSHSKRNNSGSKSFSNLKSSSSSLNYLDKKSKKNSNSKLNKSMDSITRKTGRSHYAYTEQETEDNSDNNDDEDSFEIVEEDTGEQAALQFQHIMSVSSKSINNLNNYD